MGASLPRECAATDRYANKRRVRDGVSPPSQRHCCEWRAAAYHVLRMLAATSSSLAGIQSRS